MQSPAISHQRHSVFSACLCVRPSVHDHILEVCEHGILQTACGNILGAIGEKIDGLIRL